MSASKTTTPGSTTVKVSTNTGAAKDETFSGLTEDSGAANLNVLANDPGSAKLWSLDQNALNALARSQQPQELAAYTLASGARISVNADGTVRYEGGAALQSLAEGELFTDSFIYTIRMANGALSTATAKVAITGVNDAATFSGDTSGTQTEDMAGSTGNLVVTDIDHDQSAMQASSQNGSFGALVISSAGNWTYTLTSDMNYLQDGESVSESFTVKALDGTVQTITQTIAGVNDVAAFAGDFAGSVQEEGTQRADGVLTVNDVDHDQSAFAGTGGLAGEYGDFSFDLDTGAWTYVLRNNDTNVQGLASGQEVTDRLQVTSVDGTATELVVTITGLDEPVVQPPGDTSPADTWHVTPANFKKGGASGPPSSLVNNVATIEGFTSNDKLKTSSLLQDEVGFREEVDFNGDGKLDTVLNFNHGSDQHIVVEVVLLGYTGFEMGQLV
jgi:VCBS repeat-containing protein